MRMTSLDRWRWIGPVPALALAIAGCSGVDVEQLGRDLQETRAANEAFRESLLVNAADAARVRESFDSEKAQLTAKNRQLDAALATAETELTTANKERDEAKRRLGEETQKVARFEESLEKVKSVASSSAGELSDLRLQSRELDQKVQALAKSEGTLREENSRLVARLNEANADLTKTKAAVRSLQEGGNAPKGVVSEVEMEMRRELERQVAGLKGENLALKQRVTALTGNSAATDGSTTPAATPTPPVTESTREDGGKRHAEVASVFADLWGILKERVANAVRGEVRGDAFDITVASIVSFLGITVLYFMASRRRVRKLRAQLAQERGAAAGRERAREAEAAAEASPPAKAEPPRSSRPSPIRRSGFSPVISSKAVGAGEPAARAPAATAVAEEESPAIEEEVFDRMLTKAGAPAAPVQAQGKSPSQATRKKNEGRKVIGAHSWPGEDEDNALAHTQVIQKPSDTKKAPREIVPHAAETLEPEPTQMMKPAQDREMLTELKAIIHKKFDELMK